jgi:hypothetical protein
VAALGKEKESRMGRATIQNWTDTDVLLKFGVHREVKYQVYREDDTHFLDIRNTDESPIHTLELPEALKLDRTSYEVLLRYVLMDVVAA